MVARFRGVFDLGADLVWQSAKDPVTSPYTWYRLARAPMAATETVEWAARFLAEVEREGLAACLARHRVESLKLSDGADE